MFVLKSKKEKKKNDIVILSQMTQSTHLMRPSTKYPGFLARVKPLTAPAAR